MSAHYSVFPNHNLNRNPNLPSGIAKRIRIKITIRSVPLFSAAMLVLLLAGCAVGPSYKRPDANPPATFRNSQSVTNSLGDLPWWQLFQDPVLKGLIQTALTNNYDLRIAVARVEQSRAILAQTRSGYYPQVGYELGVGGGKNVSGNQPAFTGSSAGKEYFGALDASWEIDLWGRVRRLSESARAQYFASEEARRDVTISLVSSVAQAYFQFSRSTNNWRSPRTPPIPSGKA